MALSLSESYATTIKQAVTIYRESGHGPDDLSVMARTLEAVYEQSQSLNLSQESEGQQTLKTNLVSSIYLQLLELSQQLPNDIKLSGLITGWQARHSYYAQYNNKSQPYHESPMNRNESDQGSANVMSRSSQMASNQKASNQKLLSTGSEPLYSEISTLPERMTTLTNYKPPSWMHVLVISLVVWALVKLPQWGINPFIDNYDTAQYYLLIAPVLVIFGMVSYFLYSEKKPQKQKTIWFIGLFIYSLYLLAFTFIKALNHHYEFSDTIVMMWLHSPIVLISFLGAIMYSHAVSSWRARMAYMLYLSEMGVFSILILFGGIILTLFTIMLFEMSNVHSVGEWYIENMVPLGIVATPLVATHLYFTRFKENSRLASILLQVFSPLCALTFLVYLIHMLYTGTSPVENREALIITNGLLIVIWVMSVYHIFARRAMPMTQSKEEASQFTSSPVTTLDEDIPSSHFGLMDILTTFMLLVVSLFNLVILYSMFSRFNLYGFTLNRFIVTGVNILIFTHLCQIGYQYFQLWLHPEQGDNELKKSIVNYLPIYSAWSLMVVVAVSIYSFMH